jgi:hypothetical protein
MRLDQFPREELLSLLTKVHLEHIDSFAQNKISRALAEINSGVLLKYSVEQKNEYLNGLLNQIYSEVNSYDLTVETNVYDYEQVVREKIDSLLKSVNLEGFELSNQRSVALTLEIEEALCQLIDELNILLDTIKNSKLSSWEQILQGLYQKSDSNVRRFDEYKEKFDYSVSRRSEDLLDIFGNRREFYETIPAEMLDLFRKSQERHEILLLYVEGESIPDKAPKPISPKKAAEVLSIFEQYLTTQKNSLFKDIDVIRGFKDEIDFSKVSIGIRGLYRELNRIDGELSDTSVYLALKKKEFIIEKLKNLSNDLTFESLYTRKPEVNNLVLFSRDINDMRVRLAKCHELLNGIFIEECPFTVFLGLFEKNQFIHKVNWLGKNSELNYLIKGIAGKLDHDYWIRANKCFLGKGVSLEEKTSISSPRAKPLNDDDPRKHILDKVIALIMSEGTPV